MDENDRKETLTCDMHLEEPSQSQHLLDGCSRS